MYKAPSILPLWAAPGRRLEARFQKREKFWQLSTTLSHIFGCDGEDGEAGKQKKGGNKRRRYRHLYPDTQTDTRGVMNRPQHFSKESGEFLKSCLGIWYSIHS